MTDRMTLEQVRYIEGFSLPVFQDEYKEINTALQQHAALLEAFAAAGINDPWKLAERIKAGTHKVMPREMTEEMQKALASYTGIFTAWGELYKAAPTHGGQDDK